MSVQPTVRVGTFGCQVIRGVLSQLCLNGPIGSKTHPVAVFPDPECITLINILTSWQNTHTGSQIYGVKTIMVGKAKCKPLELHLFMKILTVMIIIIIKSNTKCHIPRGITEISATIKDLKDASMVTVFTPHSPHLSGPCTRWMDLEE